MPESIDLTGETVGRYRVVSLLGDLSRLEGTRYVPSYDRAIEERSGWLAYLHVDPRLDPIRSEARFQEVMKRIGLR